LGLIRIIVLFAAFAVRLFCSLALSASLAVKL